MFVFSTYLIVFLLKFRSGDSLDAEFDSASNEHPHCILLTGLATPKARNTWKNVRMMASSHFSGISCFLGSRVRQKYVVWVLVGCGIKFCIQRGLSLEIWVKTQGDMSKIRTKKVVFFYEKMSIQPLWLTHFIEIPLVLEFQHTKTDFGTFSYKAHFRPQISSNDWKGKKHSMRGLP